MTDRRVLPARRRCETFEIAFGGLAKGHTVSVGYYNDGTPGEVLSRPTALALSMPGILGAE